MAQNVVQPPSSLFKDVIAPKYIFGYRGDFKNNIFLHQEPLKIIYPAGNNVVIYNTENKSQSFLYTYPGTCSITAMTISPSRRYLAWAEEADTGIIVVQDLQLNKKKTLTSIESGSRTYISLSFPMEETKALIALTGPPEWNIIFWDWNKGKCLSNYPLSMAQTRLYHCFCHPKEQDLVGIIGNNFFKFYKYMADTNTIKQITKKESKELGHSNFLSYCFLKDDNMIVGTDQGELLLFNNNWEFRTVLTSSPFDGFPIESIIACKRGFLMGGQNCTIYQYEKHDGDLKMPYIRLDRKIQNKDSKSRITSLLLTADDEYLIIGTEDGHFFQTLFSREMNEEKLEPVFLNFHTNKITGLDVCIRKALVATCSLDKTVKVWNYSESVSTITAEYDEEALALAFHPSGFHLVVAFQDKIRMLNIFDDHLLTYKEINNIKGCREVSFCNGGHLFAIANTNIIHVFQTYTGENPQNYVFRGHTGKVVSIHWMDNDLGFFSASNDGTVFEFRLDESSEKKTQVMSNSNFVISSVISAGFDTLYVGGVDPSATLPEEKYIYQIRYSTKEVKDHDNIMHDLSKKFHYDDPVKIFTGANTSQVLLSKSNKLFFFGTDEKDMPGAVRVSRYPLATENDILDYQTHFRGISKLKISFDDNYVFSAGSDGSLIIYEVRDKDTKSKKDKVMGFAEEFLIQKEKYIEKTKQIENLKSQIEEYQLRNKIKEKKEQREQNETLRQLDEDFKQADETGKEKYNSLLRSKEKMEAEYEEKKAQLKSKHEQTKRALETDSKQKKALESQRFEELEKETAKEFKDFNTFRYEYEEKYQREIFEKKNYYDAQLMREKALRDKILQEKQEILDDYNRRHDKLEETAEEQIEKIKEDNEDEIKRKRDAMEKAHVDKTKMKDKYDTESQKLEDLKTKLKEIREDIQQIEEANKQLNKELEGYLKEIEERNKTIDDKTRRIAELKKKTQELEKFKFVLDYKIKELKRNIGPREEEIAKMKEQIANMNAEILHFKRTKDNLLLIVKDLHFRQKGMKIEIEGLEKVKTKNKNYINSFETEVSECYQTVNNFKFLKKRILGLYNKYVQNEKKKIEIAMDLQAEFINQREHLETNVKSLKLKFEKNMEAHLQDNKRIMKENVYLIKEINDLKREKKILKDEMAKKQSQVGTSLNKKKNLSGVAPENYEELITTQRIELKQLQDKIKELAQKNQELKDKRPPSGKKLTPVMEVKP